MWNKTQRLYCRFGAGWWQNCRHVRKGSAAEGSEWQSWFVAQRQKQTERSLWGELNAYVSKFCHGILSSTAWSGWPSKFHLLTMRKNTFLWVSNNDVLFMMIMIIRKCSFANVPGLDNVCQRLTELNCTWPCMDTHTWDPRPKLMDVLSRETLTAYWITFLSVK